MKFWVSLASLFFILFMARVASSVLGPIALACVLAIAFEPFTIWMQRRGFSRGLAAISISCLLVAALTGLTILVSQSIYDFAGRLPEIGGNLSAEADRVTGWMQANGLGSVVHRIQSGDPTANLDKIASNAASSIAGVTQFAILVLLITGFMQFDAPSIRAALTSRSRRSNSDSLEHTEDVVEAGLAQIRRYILVKGCLSLAGGVMLGLWCWAWGVEGALMWGTLAALLNFIPIVGSLISAVPPVLLAFAVNGVGTALGVAAGYVAVNLIVDNMVEPKIMGKAVGLSPLVVLFAMLCWGFVLGPVGALLAVPLTIIVRTGLLAAGYDWVDQLLDDQIKPVVANT